MYILDNKARNKYQDDIKKECKMQMELPNTYRRNKAETAIQTFKNHSIAILTGVDPRFPILLWSKLLPQAVLSLNLVCPPNVCLNVSAHAFMHGQFDYNTMPLGILGCAIHLYMKPYRHKTWGKHSNNRCYNGTFTKQYCCHHIWNKKQKQNE